ncbi:MAG TPA: hypothetical protein VF848_11235 [Steroidobacteraceae bacterium]
MDMRGRARTLVMMLCALPGGCAGSGGLRPVEFLDEHTAASVTVVAKPMAFAHPRASIAANVSEYVSVTAVAVERDGKRAYLLVTRVWSTVGPDRADQSGGLVVLVADNRRIRLGDTQSTLVDFGVSVPVQAAAGIAPLSAATLTDLATLQFIAAAHSLAVESPGGAPYALFEDGRASLSRFIQYETGDR